MPSTAGAPHFKDAKMFSQVPLKEIPDKFSLDANINFNIAVTLLERYE